MLLIFLGCQKWDISELTRLGLENKENKSENPAKNLDKVPEVLAHFETYSFPLTWDLPF